MAFRDECHFEQHIRKLLKSEVVPLAAAAKVLKYKGVADIIICQDAEPPEVFFIELKYAKDMIGVSEGIQSEILLKAPIYMDDHFLWLIGSQAHEGKYWLLRSDELCPYITTKPIDVCKENNISKRLFCKRPGLDEKELVSCLVEWIEQNG